MRNVIQNIFPYHVYTHRNREIYLWFFPESTEKTIVPDLKDPEFVDDASSKSWYGKDVVMLEMIIEKGGIIQIGQNISIHHKEMIR